MDRIRMKKLVAMTLTGSSLLLFPAVPVGAGTILATPESAFDGPAAGDGGQTFPESRFGHAPAPVNLGVTKGYASQAVDEMERPEDGETGGRRLASVGGKTQVEPIEMKNRSAARAGVQEVAIIAGDLGFFPKTLFVSRDVPVRMFVTGASKNTLCIMMDSFQVRRQIRSQKIEEITFTPNMPGKYRFYCPVNGMEGTMIVKEFASNGNAGNTNPGE